MFYALKMYDTNAQLFTDPRRQAQAREFAQGISDSWVKEYSNRKTSLALAMEKLDRYSDARLAIPLVTRASRHAIYRFRLVRFLQESMRTCVSVWRRNFSGKSTQSSNRQPQLVSAKL